LLNKKENITMYYIAVVSKNHISRGVAGGFMQANHGKSTSIKKLHKDDWVIIYSPKLSFEGNQPLQAFTAIGQVSDEELYQHRMSENFNPFRRNVTYYQCNETPIAPLISKLDFVDDVKSWGYRFRFGFFEIGEHDFELIRDNMIKDELAITHQL
jgi:hypothetical protein